MSSIARNELDIAGDLMDVIATKLCGSRLGQMAADAAERERFNFTMFLSIAAARHLDFRHKLRRRAVDERDSNA